MSRCFICLKKSTHRVCPTCTCTAHPICWGKYTKNSENMKTIICTDRVVISSPITIKCPQCRANISLNKRLIRSDTQLAREVVMAYDFNYFEVAINEATDKNEIHSLYKLHSETLRENKVLIRNTENLDHYTKNYLKTAYKNGWKEANLVYMEIFGKQLVECEI